MKNDEVEKSKAFILVDIIEYVPNTIVSKTIFSKITGTICAISCDSGQAIKENILPFDTFIQIIDGKAEIAIEGKWHFLVTGESIIIPAHCHSMTKATVRFKILSTIIKSGYEDML